VATQLLLDEQVDVQQSKTGGSSGYEKEIALTITPPAVIWLPVAARDAGRHQRRWRECYFPAMIGSFSLS
jgi:hypothetical protein